MCLKSLDPRQMPIDKQASRYGFVKPYLLACLSIGICLGSRLFKHILVYFILAEKDYYRSEQALMGRSRRVGNAQGERVIDCKPFRWNARRSSPQSGLLNVACRNLPTDVGVVRRVDSHGCLRYRTNRAELSLCAEFNTGGTAELVCYTGNFVPDDECRFFYSLLLHRPACFLGGYHGWTT